MLEAKTPWSQTKNRIRYVPGQVCARIFTGVWERAAGGEETFNEGKRRARVARSLVGSFAERKGHARLIFSMRSAGRSTSISSGRGTRNFTGRARGPRRSGGVKGNV